MNTESRLEAFEKMLTAVRENYNQADNKLKQLKAKGKEKSATYRQLAGSKMQYRNMLSMYCLYGLIGEDDIWYFGTYYAKYSHYYLI